MTIRIPFAWEGKPDPIEGAGSVDYADILPVHLPFGGAHPAYSRTRDTRDELERRALDMTDGSPAAREWARSKAAKAVDTWDRGVASGQIKLPTD